MPEFDPRDLDFYEPKGYVVLKYLYVKIMECLILDLKLGQYRDESDGVIKQNQFDRALAICGSDISIYDSLQEPAWQYVRDFLFMGHVKAVCFDDEIGKVSAVPFGFWGGKLALSALSNNRIDDNHLLGMKGVVIVVKEEVDELISSEIENLRNVYVEDALIMDRVRSDEKQSFSNLSATLRLAIIASQDLGLVDGHHENGTRIGTKKVEHWLQEHWPVELGVYSENLAKKITTIIRNQKDMTGGLLAPQKSAAIPPKSH